MSADTKCIVCDTRFAELDLPIKCDGCATLVHNKCSGLTTSEIKCVSLKNRTLKYFCTGCENGLKDLPQLKLLIKKLLVEVEGLKNSHSFSSNNSFDNGFIINEINDRNSRATNLIFYNIEESDSNQLDDRITHDFIQIKNTLKSIGVDSEIVQLKVNCLDRYKSGKLRPIKAVFSTSSNTFDILKNKRKLSSCSSFSDKH
ncbi:unnamed protein product [Macrosiphum euphorbiae]|uniref:Zinc finger PHD-type domain-containing protein n=1 Tax=Macrosiphum euphorbiae TaxID=13131 RepID=A0AAV0WCG5_9HEMI|nr:unnamed protein product [Macrosiphum euphorbiae]